MDKAPEAFRTISEVADWLGVQPHVLRFWESKFPQIKPVKRAGGRRYYRPTDMRLLGGLRKLLHEDGLTIKWAQKVLREQGAQAVQEMSPPLEDMPEPGARPEPAPVQEQARPRGGAMQDDDRQAVLDLPQIRRRPGPTETPEEEEEDTAPVSARTAAAKAAASPGPTTKPEMAMSPRAGRPEPDGPAAPDSPVAKAAETPPPPPPGAKLPATPPADPAAAPKPPAAPDRQDEAAPVPAFRSRLGGTLAAEARAQPDTAAEPPRPTPVPARKPLPPEGTPLEDALSALEPGQVKPIRLLPIFEQMVALRDRMDRTA